MFNSILDAIENYSQSQPDKLCFRSKKEDITYKKYFDNICMFADLLAKNNISKDDKVIIKSEQTVDYLTAFHAVQLLGAVPVPLEKNAKESNISEIAKIVSTRFLIGANSEDKVCISYEQLKNHKEILKDFSLPESSDVAEILFTTGTTGKSKGVIMTHKADVAVAENVLYGVKMKKNNMEIIPMPLNHSFALRRYYANIINGSGCILLDGVIFVQNVFDALDKLGATSMAMAPSALSIILKLSKDKISKYNDKIDYLQFGSSHLSENEKNKILELLPETRLYNIYGSTEGGCSCILNFNSEDNLPYCIGYPTVNSDILFVDENGTEIETNEENTGRLITKGKMLMKAYFAEEELTKQTLINEAIYSSDVGYKDAKGRVFMLGRNDDVIISGGQKIAPTEVEDICLKYDGIDDCAVIGVSDKLMGQIPKVFVVPNTKYNKDNMIQFLSERLESFQVPKIVEVIDKIPRTFNGKILRKKLI